MNGLRPWRLCMAFLLLLLVGCVPAPAAGNVLIEQSFPPAATLPSLATTTVPPSATSIQPKPTSALRLAQLIQSITASDTPTPTATSTTVPTATPVPSPTPCASPGQIVTGAFENTLTGPLSYRVYLPPCYGQEGLAYPTLYMLPGNIHTDSIWDELGLDEAAEQGILNQAYPPFLIVMVAGGYLADSTSGGPGSYEELLVSAFIPYIERSYCVWSASEARAIGGLSRGGYWALEIAFRHPAAFASVGGHSAALFDVYGGPAVNPEDTGLTNDLGDLRVYFDIGENDWVIGNVQRLHERMEEAGIEHLWIVNPGAHEEAYWARHVTDYLDYYTSPWLPLRDQYPRCQIGTAEHSP